MNPLTTLVELQEAIAVLPPVPPGKVRVYRGQTTDHKTIVPASFRTHLVSRSAWSIYSRFLLSDISPDGTERRLASEELRIQALWLEAIAQHYGNGSSYLDVTHSIESAAWFALHQGKFVTERRAVDNATTGSLAKASYEEKWLEYVPATEPGFIYAFDVDDWDGTAGAPPPLALVDLSRAPAPFHTPRMAAQLGCVIRTLDTDGYDFKCHCVSLPPIPVAWPLSGSEFVERSVEQIFPAPSIDQWYSRLLNIPMAPDVDEDSGTIIFRRALPVTLYRAKSDSYNEELLHSERFLDPPLLHERLQKDASRVQASDLPKDEHLRTTAMTEALPIVLEAPLLRIFPQADSTLWNHELLISDVFDPVPTYLAGQKNATGNEVPTTNVVIQFSALEETDWGAITSARRLVRGLWMARQGEEIAAALVTQNLPQTQIECEPTILFRYAPNLRRLIYRHPEVKSWRLLSSLPETAKCIFVALYLLRCLCPRWKVEATPLRFVIGDPIPGIETNFFYPSVLADEARLRRVKGPAAVADWFALRNRTDDSFTTPTATSPYMKIQTAAAFADFPVTTFHDYIAANQAGFDQFASSSARPR